jgi:hypothetical protein
MERQRRSRNHYPILEISPDPSPEEKLSRNRPWRRHGHDNGHGLDDYDIYFNKAATFATSVFPTAILTLSRTTRLFEGPRLIRNASGCPG